MASSEVYARARAVRLVIFDVDGVLTDGGLFIDDRGGEYKVFYARDGHGIKTLVRSGVEVGVISGRDAPAVSRRMESLYIRHVYQGREDKLPVFLELLDKLSMTPAETAFIGDDVVDLPVLRRAGLAVAVADAHPLVKQNAHWETPSRGGRGAARDVCDLVMHAKGTLEAHLQRYLDGP